MAKADTGVTKSELIDAVTAKLRMPRGRAELVVNVIFDSMVDALKTGEGIEIRGFGTFTIREYKSYEGRNPRTGARVHVAPKKLPFFKVGKELRERVDHGRLRWPRPGQEAAPAPGAPPSVAPSPSAAPPTSANATPPSSRIADDKPIV